VQVDELRSLLLEPGGGVFRVPLMDYDEVYPGVLLGGKWVPSSFYILMQTVFE
jgi:hypothetical protein